MWQIIKEKEQIEKIQNAITWEKTTGTKNITRGPNKGKYTLYWNAAQGGLWLLTS